MKLDGVEFLRRFLMHVLPSGFMRIRHFGFLAHCVRQVRVALLRHLLKLRGSLSEIIRAVKPPAAEFTPCLCPLCQAGVLRLLASSQL